MCGRYTVLTEDEIIEIRGILQELSLRIVRDDFDTVGDGAETRASGEAGRSEVFPTNMAPVILPAPGGVAFESLKWGFKRFNGSGVIINARCESLRSKGTFSDLLDIGRCIVPAAEFFEWQDQSREGTMQRDSNSDVKKKKAKKKHHVKDKDGNLLFMAGLYRVCDDEREFVIITKNSTGEVSNIHDRVPVVLRADQIESWLNGKLAPDDLMNLDCDFSVIPCEEESDGNASLIPGGKDEYGQISLFDS